ncbi:thymidylate synthase [Clavibacter lycopersici]|uniref:thymidylate synthase n=2 Tax=Clavibacter lycopersici TaxID=2301718 RepID=A0A399TCR1_9MICO|nr:thymidylate synthase [Clavibacter lycopersici]RIJ62586.1 thymidylate synthase [Clavibacter lycopersici]
MSLTLTNPLARMSRSANRGRLFSALGELTWYLDGSSDPAHILYYLPRYGEAVGEYGGSYGPRLFGLGNNAQIHGVIAQLTSSPSTRKAVVQLYDRDDVHGNPRDVPCTCTLQFFVRNGRVDLITYMRSNDAILGLMPDVFAFTFLQELVARSLGYDLGTYTHMVGSLHVYSEREADARAYLDEGSFPLYPMPPMPLQDPWEMVQQLLNAESNMRNGLQPLYPDDSSSYWRNLGLVLGAWRAFKDSDKETLRKLHEMLSATVYGTATLEKCYALGAL